MGVWSAVLVRREVPYLWRCEVLPLTRSSSPNMPGHLECWRCHNIHFALSGTSAGKVIMLDLLCLPRLLVKLCSCSFVSSMFVAVLSLNRKMITMTSEYKEFHTKERKNQPTKQVEGFALNSWWSSRSRNSCYVNVCIIRCHAYRHLSLVSVLSQLNPVRVFAPHFSQVSLQYCLTTYYT